MLPLLQIFRKQGAESITEKAKNPEKQAKKSHNGKKESKKKNRTPPALYPRPDQEPVMHMSETSGKM